MKEAKKARKLVANLGIMAIVIAGSFLGSTIAMNIFIGITVLVFIILLIGHISAEKTVEESPNVAAASKKLLGGKLLAIQYVVIFISLAGAGHWILFFTWIIISFASIALTERYKQMSDSPKKEGTECS